MFKPCPKCGFLVALIRGREASQRCPRCGSALVEAADADATDATRATRDAAAGADPPARRSIRTDDTAGVPPARSDAVARPVDEPAASNALRTHAERPPEARDAPAGREAAEADAARSDASPADAAPRDIATDASPADAPATARMTDAPAFARRRAVARTATGRRWPAVVATGALALLLAVQLLLAQRDALANDARWRPLVSTACSVLGCALPPWREPAAFAMLARGVRPDPRRPGVLRVSTTVRNDAQWPQPLPVVVLQLSDIDGRIVGARAVPPRDYARRADALVPPRASVDIAFDVREPAARVVSFDFQLR